MSENDESLSGAEIADLARRLFGPEEGWDDAAAEFVLRLHGIDPGDSGDEIAYGIKLILNVIERQKKQDKEVPRELTTILQELTAERDRDPRINEAQNQLEKALRAGAGAGRQVVTKLRRTGKLSAKDEEILKQLEANLLAESNDD
jgi:dihydropteroate synthase